MLEYLPMNITDFIRKKRDGEAHTREEIEALVKGFGDRSIPDYQITAWLMAVFYQGMTETETTHLTRAMAYSGDILDLSSVEGIKVDKHSTGGVGDKVTLVLAPLVASTGLVVAKLSGRGLGHTGGTIDKLEAIPGFQTSLSTDDFMAQLRKCGVAVAGQTQNLAPADKTLYALRDVTATVDSIPLIVGSVLSKKIASGADVIVLDVKYGSGAFMPDYESAKKLAETLVKVGGQLGRSVSVLLSDMEQPLGDAIGHTLEVQEAIDTLKGQGPEDLLEVTLTLGAMQLMNAERVDTLEDGKNLLMHHINSGKALVKFKEMIQAQQGDPEVLTRPEMMPQAQSTLEITATTTGYVHRLHALSVGKALKALGGGRDKKSDVLDLAVGVVLHKKLGDAVQAGDLLATLHVNPSSDIETAKQFIQNAYTLGPDALKEEPQLIRDIIWAK